MDDNDPRDIEPTVSIALGWVLILAAAILAATLIGGLWLLTQNEIKSFLGAQN